MKQLFQKYKHAWVFLYSLIYFPWFLYLEKQVTQNYTLIQIPFDKKIPFVEYFVVPYLLWFLFLLAAVFYFFFTNKSDFYRLMTFLIIGMTLFLVISTLFPNGQALRPAHFERNNIFIELTKYVYQSDTPTNVFPSIHVYNSLGVHIAVQSSEQLKKLPLVQVISFIIAVLIILSTMFLKQHSIIDAVGAGIIAVIVYCIVYVRQPKREHAFSHLLS